MANLSDSPAGASVHGLGSALPSDSSQAYNEAPKPTMSTMMARSLTHRALAQRQPYFSIYGLTPFWPVKP